MPVVIRTLREFLLGSLTDFAVSSGLNSLGTTSNLASLIVSLAHYQEEGSTLTPEVFLCCSIDSILQMLPGHEKVQIGSSPSATEAIERAVKRCAPIARDGWCIYVEEGQGLFPYGLFRGSLNPLSVSVERTLFTEAMDIRVIRLCRTANGCVQLKNQRGDVHHIMLSDRPQESVPTTEEVRRLVQSICRRVPTSRQDSVRTMLEKSIQTALTAAHGAIIAVTARDHVPAFLKDGVSLEAPIDFSASVARKLAANADSEADYRLVGNRILLAGMVSSDGITLFSSRAKLVAYNCFIAGPPGAKPVNGGARTRAFEELAKRLGRGVDAVLMQSQDGWVRFRSNSDGN